MAAPFTRLQLVYCVLVVGGGLAALAADRLGSETYTNVGISAVMLGAIVFGLDMIVQRKAEISTSGSSDTDPAFHVFRGVAAVAWGIVFVVGGLLFAGSAYLTITDSAEARSWLAERSGIVIMLAGLLLTALGVGQASRATYRYQETEKPVRRLGGRIYALVFLLPLGLATLLWGAVRTFSPALADRTVAATKATAVALLERWLAN